MLFLSEKKGMEQSAFKLTETGWPFQLLSSYGQELDASKPSKIVYSNDFGVS